MAKKIVKKTPATVSAAAELDAEIDSAIKTISTMKAAAWDVSTIKWDESEVADATPPPASTSSKKAPETRKSLFGNYFNHSYESEWTEVPGVGWYHLSEAQSFQMHYKLCEVSKKYFKTAFLFQCAEMRGGEMTQFYIHRDHIKDGWVMCQSSGNYVKKSETLPFISTLGHEEYGHKVYVSEMKVCDYLNKPVANWKHIKDSDKYKIVALHLIGDHESCKPFGKCPNCGHFFESAMLKPIANYGKDHYCPDCSQLMLKKNAVGAYNDKHYPKAIVPIVSRLGHEIKDGLVYATNKPVPKKIVRLYGVELETEFHKPGLVKAGINRYDMALALKKLLSPDFVNIKEDGTLVMNGKYDGDSSFDPDGKKNGPLYAGFEIVSAPAFIETHRERWFALEKFEFYKHMRAWDTQTCGFHVHVTRESLTQLQIGKMLRFINHGANAKFIHKIAGRGSDKYCRYVDKKVVDILHPDRVCSPEETSEYHRKRRVALNISNPHTVEWRIFRGTVNPRHIIRNIEFCEAMCDYCYPCSRPLSHMDSYPEFIKFVGESRKKYPMLASWFVHQKHLTIKKVGEGADPSKFTIKPEYVVEPDPVKLKESKDKVVASTESEF